VPQGGPLDVERNNRPLQMTQALRQKSVGKQLNRGRRVERSTYSSYEEQAGFSSMLSIRFCKKKDWLDGWILMKQRARG
jgi:hypothetical protein